MEKIQYSSAYGDIRYSIAVRGDIRYSIAVRMGTLDTV